VQWSPGFSAAASWKVDVLCAGMVVVVDGELDSSLMIAVEVGEVETGKSSKKCLQSQVASLATCIAISLSHGQGDHLLFV
jgi:hypothetical protein